MLALRLLKPTRLHLGGEPSPRAYKANANAQCNTGRHVNAGWQCRLAECGQQVCNTHTSAWCWQQHCRLAGMMLAARSAGSHCRQAVLAGQHVQTGRAVLAVLAGVLRCALAVCSWCYQARLMFYVGWTGADAIAYWLGCVRSR